MSSLVPNAAGRSPRGALVCAAVAAALWGFAGAAEAADEPFRRAADAFDRRDWKSAAAAFDACLRSASDPETVAEAHYFLGESLAQQGQSAAARPHFQQYLARHPSGRLTRAAKFRAAEAAHLMRLDEPAAAEMREFLANYPGDPLAGMAAAMRAVSEARLGRWSLARQHYEALRRDDPANPAIAKAAGQLAALALAGGPQPWAEQLYRQQAAVADTPDAKAAALLGVGRAQRQMHRWAEAAETFAQANAHAPAAPLAAEALCLRGACLEKLDCYDAALAAYDDAVDADAGEHVQADALLASAFLSLQLRQIPSALARFERLAAEHPRAAQCATALDGMARAYSAAGREDEALSLWRRLCETHTASPLWPAAALRVAEQWCRKGKHAEAQSLVTRLLAASTASAAFPSDAASPARCLRPDALALAGRIAAAQSQWDASQAAYEHLLAEYPESQWKDVARYGVADALYRQGDLTLAVETLQPLVEGPSPVSAAVVRAARLRLAQAYGHRGQWKEALATVESLDAASLELEQRRELDYLRGRSLAALGDHAGAREAYAAALRGPQAPPPSLAASARMSLAETYFVQNDFEAALREYLLAAKLPGTESQRAASLLQAGKCCERLARLDRAAELYTQLATTYSQTTYAQEAVGRRGALGSPRPLR